MAGQVRPPPVAPPRRGPRRSSRPSRGPTLFSRVLNPHRDKMRVFAVDTTVKSPYNNINPPLVPALWSRRPPLCRFRPAFRRGERPLSLRRFPLVRPHLTESHRVHRVPSRVHRVTSCVKCLGNKPGVPAPPPHLLCCA